MYLDNLHCWIIDSLSDVNPESVCFDQINQTFINHSLICEADQFRVHLTQWINDSTMEIIKVHLKCQSAQHKKHWLNHNFSLTLALYTHIYMCVCVCVCVYKTRSKRNDDSVSVEELDWSAERQVLIPAEHFCVTSNADLEPKTHHQTPMTCTFIIWAKILLLNIKRILFFRREKGTFKLWQQRWKHK